MKKDERLQSVVEINSSFSQINLEARQDNEITLPLRDCLYMELSRSHPQVRLLLDVASILWPLRRETTHSQSRCAALVGVFWYIICRVCAIIFVLAVYALTIFSYVTSAEPRPIEIINGLIMIVCAFQVASLYPSIRYCVSRLLCPPNDCELRYFPSALQSCVVYFILVVVTGVTFLALDCYASVDTTVMNEMVFVLHFFTFVTQIFIGALLASCMLLTIVDCKVYHSKAIHLIELAKSEDLTVEALERVRKDLKRSLEVSTWNQFVLGITAMVNTFAFVLSLFYSDSLKYGQCIENQNLSLIVALYFKELAYIVVVLYFMAMANEKFDELPIQLGSTHWNQEKQLTRTVLYISLQARPLSFTVVGFRPTNRILTLQLLGFVLASGIGLFRSYAEQLFAHSEG